MNEQPVQHEPDFKPVIADNFETSGPYVGRMQNTELAVDMATAEVQHHTTRAQYERRGFSPQEVAKAQAGNKVHQDSASENVLLHADPAVSAAQTAMDAAFSEAEAAGVATPNDATEKAWQDRQQAQAPIKRDYSRLKAKRAAYDDKLLADARDRAADQYKAEKTK